MSNGKIGAFPPNMTFRFFRGENDDYDLKYPIKDYCDVDYRALAQHYEFFATISTSWTEDS